jgi:hypothetical protein
VKNATVIIRINIVAALIACVVILSPFTSPSLVPVEAGRPPGSLGVEEVSACATDRFAVFGLDPGLGRIPESLDIDASGVPRRALSPSGILSITKSASWRIR